MPGKRYWSKARRGVSLIEVLAGSALVGIVLVGAVLAHVRLERQRAMLLRKEAAILAADRMLSDWWKTPDAIPRRGHGPLSNDGLSWQVETIVDPVLEQLDVTKIAYIVLDGVEFPTEIVRVEMVVPNPSEEAP